MYERSYLYSENIQALICTRYNRIETLLYCRLSFDRHRIETVNSSIHGCSEMDTKIDGYLLFLFPPFK